VSRGFCITTLGACVLASACVREPVDAFCPAIGAGDLRVSELRGPENSVDTAEWIEIENATGAELDLEGLVVDLLSIDGGVHLRLLVREPFAVAGGERVVLGRSDDASDLVLVGWSEHLPSSGAVTLLSCGETIDRVAYEGMPTTGTYSRTGTVWCTDPTGTPGAENTPCP